MGMAHGTQKLTLDSNFADAHYLDPNTDLMSELVGSPDRTEALSHTVPVLGVTPLVHIRYRLPMDEAVLGSSLIPKSSSEGQ
jgi:hypothetical protein